MDCTKAIELLKAEAKGESSSISSASSGFEATIMTNKLLLRRGAAACSLGQYSESISDYSIVLSSLQAFESNGIDTKGLSSAAQVRQDVARLRIMAEAEALKKQGDAVFSERRLSEAADKYTEALHLLPVHVGCLSNRSACKIASGDLQGCVDDCTAALALLQIDPTSSTMGSSSNSVTADMSMLSSILPPPGSEKRASWVIKTILRRGQAYAQLQQLDEAVADYTVAASLDPKNESLRSDLNKIVNYRNGMSELKKNPNAVPQINL